MNETLLLTLFLVILLILKYINNNNIKLSLPGLFNIRKSTKYYKKSIGIAFNSQLKIIICIIIMVIIIPHIITIIIDYYLQYKPHYRPNVSLRYFSATNLIDFTLLKSYIASTLRYNINILNIGLYNQILNNYFFRQLSLISFLLLIFFSGKLDKYISDDNKKVFMFLRIMSVISWVMFLLIIWFYVTVYMDWSMYEKVSTFLLSLGRLVINSFLVTVLSYLVISLLLGLTLFYIKDIIKDKQIKWKRIFNNVLNVLLPMIILNIILNIIVSNLFEPIYNNPFYKLIMSLDIYEPILLAIYFMIKGLLVTFLFLKMYVLTIYKFSFFKTLKYSSKLIMGNIVHLIAIILIGLVVLVMFDILSVIISTVFSSYLLMQVNYVIFILDIIWGVAIIYSVILINIALYIFLKDTSMQNIS